MITFTLLTNRKHWDRTGNYIRLWVKRAKKGERKKKKMQENSAISEGKKVPRRRRKGEGSREGGTQPYGAQLAAGALLFYFHSVEKYFTSGVTPA